MHTHRIRKGICYVKNAIWRSCIVVKRNFLTVTHSLKLDKAPVRVWCSGMLKWSFWNIQVLVVFYAYAWSWLQHTQVKEREVIYNQRNRWVKEKLYKSEGGRRKVAKWPLVYITAEEAKRGWIWEGVRNSYQLAVKERNGRYLRVGRCWKRWQPCGSLREQGAVQIWFGAKMRLIDLFEKSKKVGHGSLYWWCVYRKALVFLRFEKWVLLP